MICTALMSAFSSSSQVNSWLSFKHCLDLEERGATEAEIEFLTEPDDDGMCRRVELNAMTSRQLVDLVEAKLQEHGIEKVVSENGCWCNTRAGWSSRDSSSKQLQGFRRSLPNRPRRSICREISESGSTCSSKKTRDALGRGARSDHFG